MLGIESSLPSASRASKRRSSKSFRPSLKAASGLKISTMLMICMGLFMVLIVAVGGLAAYFLQQSGDALRTINRQSDRAVQVLQLSNNMMEARLGLMSAARFYQEAGIDNDANTLQSADNLVIMANQKLDEVRKAFADLNEVECVLEKRLNLQKEMSVIVARDHKGECATFPVAENHHRKGILATTIVPARIDDAMAAQARANAISIAGALDYVGVLCVEFFVVDDLGLVVNEIAPRPHNSGHYSIDACVTCQFEQQARVLAGLPLGDTRQHSPAVMVNLLGDLWYGEDGSTREPAWEKVLAIPEVKLHLYGKEQARVGRKMGHITVIAETLDRALAVAQEVRDILGIGDDDD